MAQVSDTSGATAPRNVTKLLEGRPFAIQKYCLAAILKDHTECLWLRMKRRGRVFATDIPLAVLIIMAREDAVEFNDSMR
jgi:hypothetical protein